MNLRLWSTLSVLALTIGPVALGGEQKEIPLETVPAELRKIPQDLFPDASFSSANTEAEANGTLIYEIKGGTPDGRKVEVDLFANGGIEEVEIEFTEAQVPGAVMNAVEKKLPGFQATYIEASQSPSGKVTRYEFEGTLGGKELDIEVSADGRRIEVADN